MKIWLSETKSGVERCLMYFCPKVKFCYILYAYISVGDVMRGWDWRRNASIASDGICKTPILVGGLLLLLPSVLIASELWDARLSQSHLLREQREESFKNEILYILRLPYWGDVNYGQTDKPFGWVTRLWMKPGLLDPSTNSYEVVLYSNFETEQLLALSLLCSSSVEV